MEYNTIHDINTQISKAKNSILVNIEDMPSEDVTVIYTALIKVSNILLDRLMVCQNKRENDNELWDTVH